MPTQVFRIRPPMHMRPPRQQQDCPEWVVNLFAFTAEVGALAVTMWVISHASELWGHPWTADQIILGGSLLLGAVLVLWRQLELKRWACFVACLVAWSLAYLSISSVFHMPASLLDLDWIVQVLILLIAPVMTAACIAGWHGLERGF